jgi:hypothetical protein
MKSVGWLLAGIGARFHVACGWLAYRLGCRRAARNHFERVLLLRGADFVAYVNLARIAFDVGDYAGWRRELEHARRLDPERFARLRHPLELFEPRLAGTSLDRPHDEGEHADGEGGRATWRALRPSGSGSRTPSRSDSFDAGLDALLPGLDARAEAVPQPRAGVGKGDPPPDAKHSHDDCLSTSERARFRELGPIARAEWKGCDLDDLLRRLSG